MKKSFVFPFILLCCTILGLSGCGAGGVSRSADTHAVEGLDPFAYGDEFALQPDDTSHRAAALGEEPVIKAPAKGRVTVSKISSIPAAAVDSAAALVPVETTAPASGMVYRVQIGIYEERKSADLRADEARDKVTLPVYVEFEPPFYRVRVGDFKTREEAEQEAKVLQTYGFRGSFWVVKNLGTP